MLPTSANSSSSVNDCGASVYNSEADLAFIHTAECVYTKGHFCMADFPLFPHYLRKSSGGSELSVLSNSTCDVTDLERVTEGRMKKR